MLMEEIEIREESLSEGKKLCDNRGKNGRGGEPRKVAKNKNKKKVIILALILVVILGGVAAFLALNKPKNEELAANDGKTEEVHYYDNLTGEEIASEEENKGRINCIQIPNGTDARPQVGLSDAKIVYEAIAEGGITRFAALFRNSNSDVIGPVRSLRMYYLEWDIPYDCTIIHAGGVQAAVDRADNYAHLSESTTYMWRDYSDYVAPNNLFTSPALLKQFNDDNNYIESKPKTFARMTPKESETELMAKDVAASDTNAENENTEGEAAEKAESIYVHITTAQNYNVIYTYDKATNSYLRAYEGNSGKHISYNCKNTGKVGNQIRPQRDCGEATQLAPKVVVVMKVPEELNSDNHYREEITTDGSGEVLVFQNGLVKKGTWSRRNAEEQLVFKDENGEILKLAPGQTWITAIAKSYGYVKY